MEIVSIKSLKSYWVGTFVLKTKYTIRQYYEFSNIFVSREEDDEGRGYLFAYGYSNNNYKLIWQIVDKDIFSIARVFPNLEEDDFISLKHYEEYKKKYNNKELLEVYCANWPYDFRYLINANTGEIYSKAPIH